MADSDVSFAPSEAATGGGLLASASGVTCTFEFVGFDYGGSVAVAVPALHVHGEYADENGDDQEFDEYYSCGDPSKLRPKKDGTGLQAVSEGARMHNTCKAMQFLSSLVSANGGDEEIVQVSNIKDLDGINLDLERKPDMDRQGLAPKATKPGQKAFQRTIMLVTAINSMPGEAKAKGKKGSAKPAAPGKANALKKKTAEAVKAVLEAAGGTAEVGDIPQLLFRKNKKDPEVKAMTELAAEEDFYTSDDLGWTHNAKDDTLSLDEE